MAVKPSKRDRKAIAATETGKFAGRMKSYRETVEAHRNAGARSDATGVQLRIDLGNEVNRLLGPAKTRMEKSARSEACRDAVAGTKNEGGAEYRLALDVARRLIGEEVAEQ